MSNIETEFEYRDRVTARLFPDRLTWFFRIPAMYLVPASMTPLGLMLMDLAGGIPSNVRDVAIGAMTMTSLVGAPLGVATLIWLINRTGFLIRRDPVPRKSVRIVLVVLTIAACVSIQVVGTMFGVSRAGLVFIGVLALEFMTAREFAGGARLVDTADAQRRSLL